MRAYENESVAVALFAAGVRVLSRSAKVHRPRGFFCLAGHCGACLMRIDGIPNVKACMTPCRTGLAIERQNAWPNARVDILGAVDFAFSDGFDPHQFLTRPALLNHLMKAGVRRLSGLGRLPDAAAPAVPAEGEHVDVLVIGAGPAGLAAARTAASRGARTLLVDDQNRPGGRLLTDAEPLVRAAEKAKVALRSRSTVFGFFPEDGRVWGVATPEGLLLVRANTAILATGGYEQNTLFPGNDIPGVLPLRAVDRLLVRYGLRPGRRVVVLGESAEAQRLVDGLRAHGAKVERASTITRALGRAWVRRVVTDDGRVLPCDLLVTSEPPAPASELARVMGAETAFSASAGGFCVVADAAGKTSCPTLFACGDVCGARSVEDALRSGELAGISATA